MFNLKSTIFLDVIQCSLLAVYAVKVETLDFLFCSSTVLMCLQERSLSHKSAIMMKVDVPEEETSSCKNAENGTQCSPVTHSFSSSTPIFGSSGKLGILKS